MKSVSVILLLPLIFSLLLQPSECYTYNEIYLNIPNLGRIAGKVSNFKDTTNRELYSFYDIPYGEPITKEQRFKRPKPIQPWSGIYNATSVLPQFNYFGDYYAMDEFANYENFLYLSIVTPNLTGNYPVIVCLLSDTQNINDYPLNRNAHRSDLINVFVRYRLNVLGFLSTLTSEIPGNAGVFDVILALQWIQNHIDTFGGDPNQVTLFGEFQGAAIVNLLTVSPKVPTNLFHRVIYSDSSIYSPEFVSNTPIEGATEIAKAMGCNPENMNKCFLQADIKVLLAAYYQHYTNVTHGFDYFGGNMITINAYDGLLPEYPRQLLNENKTRAYPTLGLSTRNLYTEVNKDIFYNQKVPNLSEHIGEQQIQKILFLETESETREFWLKFAVEKIFTPNQIQNGNFQDMKKGLEELKIIIVNKKPILDAVQANAKYLPEQTYLLTNEIAYTTYDGTEDEDILEQKNIELVDKIVESLRTFAIYGVPNVEGKQCPPLTNSDGPYLIIGQDSTVVGNNFEDEYFVNLDEKHVNNI